MLEEKKGTPLKNVRSFVPADGWHVIPAARFARYTEWINREGNLCGTYSAAVMLAYWQDWLDGAVVPDKLHLPKSADGQKLLQLLRMYTQLHGFSTTPFQVAWGLRRFFAHYHIPYTARFAAVGGWQIVKHSVARGEPLIVGLLQWKGSRYGNHWVTCFGYRNQGKRELLVHDNWGKSASVIPAVWMNGAVWIVPHFRK